MRPTSPTRPWQSDFTYYRLQDSTPHVTHRGGVRRVEIGTDVEVLTWLDDCARYALSVTAHQSVTGPIVLATFRKAAATQGFPTSTLTDNGRVFTVRLFGGTPGRNHLEHELRRSHARGERHATIELIKRSACPCREPA